MLNLDIDPKELEGFEVSDDKADLSTTTAENLDSNEVGFEGVNWIPISMKLVLKPYFTFPITSEPRKYVLKIQWNGDGEIVLQEDIQNNIPL